MADKVCVCGHTKSGHHSIAKPRPCLVFGCGCREFRRARVSAERPTWGPKEAVKPPTVGPKGGAGNSGAAQLAEENEEVVDWARSVMNASNLAAAEEESATNAEPKKRSGGSRACGTCGHQMHWHTADGCVEACPCAVKGGGRFAPYPKLNVEGALPDERVQTSAGGWCAPVDRIAEAADSASGPTDPSPRPMWRRIGGAVYVNLPDQEDVEQWVRASAITSIRATTGDYVSVHVTGAPLAWTTLTVDEVAARISEAMDTMEELL